MVKLSVTQDGVAVQARNARQMGSRPFPVPENRHAHCRYCSMPYVGVGCGTVRGHAPDNRARGQPQQVSPTTQAKRQARTARSAAKRQAEAAKKANEAANRKASKQREFEEEEEGEGEDRVPPGTPDNKKRGRDTPATPKKYQTHC